jgi:tetratricopeptide (TPR) repeat protein
VVGSPDTVKLLTHYIIGFRNFFRNVPEAQRAYRAMIELQPKCAAAHLKLGILLILNGKNREGIARLEEADRLAPGDAETAYSLGSGWYNLGELDPAGERSPHYRKSLEAFRRAVRLSPNYADAHWGVGSALYKTGKFLEAREPLETCLKINPFFAEGYNTLASVLLRQAEAERDPAKKTARQQEAAQTYQQSLRANPNSEMAHYNLGVVYHQMSRWKEAQAEYEAALRLNPKFALALYRLGRMYTDRKGFFDRGRAEDVYTRLLALEPGNCDYIYDFGAFHFNSRQWEKAKEQWRRAIQACPGHKAAQAGLEQLIEMGY